MQTALRATLPATLSSAKTLPKTRRLKLRVEIDHLLRNGLFVRGHGIHARVLPWAPQEIPVQGRLLVAVPKRYGTAPRRNRIKRWIREATRNHSLWLHLPWDVGFFVSKTSQGMVDFEQVCQEINNLLLIANKRYANPLGRKVP